MNGSLFTGPMILRYLGGRSWQNMEPFGFVDPKCGLRAVPPTFKSDLATIRPIRTMAHVCLVIAAILWVFHPGPIANTFFWIGIVAMALYAIAASYFNRAGLLHDWEYFTGALSKWQCDLLFYRAARAEGHSIWRSAGGWFCVALGGWPAWIKHRRASKRLRERSDQA